MIFLCYFQFILQSFHSKNQVAHSGTNSARTWQYFTHAHSFILPEYWQPWTGQAIGCCLCVSATCCFPSSVWKRSYLLGYILNYFSANILHCWIVDESRTRKRDKAVKLETLWIYGDSVGDFFYKSIVKQPLCTKIFQRCNSTYNWVYTIPGRNLTRARLENDDKDFSNRRVLSEIIHAVSQPFMDSEKSGLILNLGLHYVHTINFSTYMVLIDKTIRLLNERFKVNKNSWRFRGKLIWKTTTAINKEKYGDPRTNARHSTSIRFLTYQVRWTCVHYSICH